ncbi:MAG: extracellular solute-binding protein [Candidatus Hydrogenedentes bacterium]|nr:extracellular solute-binding protein [Candidatus Hydrogenedentota bacterium]
MHIHPTIPLHFPLPLLLLFLLPALCSAEPITIQAGSLGVNEDWCPAIPDWFAQQAASFTAANPAINVDLLGIAGPARDQLPIQDIPVLARNIVGIDALSGYDAAWLATRGDIVPIDDFLPDPQFNKDDFYDNLWPPVTVDGKIWAVPLVASPLVFLYRTDLFQTAGIAGPPKTWDELVACARAVATTPGMPSGLRPLYAPDIEQIVLTMLIQQGGDLIHDNKFDPLIDRLTELAKPAQALDAFTAGQYPGESLDLNAMIIGSPGLINKISRATRAKWRLAPLPTSARNIQVPYQIVYLAVRSAKPEYQAASWQFIKWLVRPDAPRPASLIPMPCRKSFAENLAKQNTADYLFQDVQLLWTSLGQLQDYGPNNLFNRRQALESIAQSAGQLLQPRQAQASTDYAEILQKVNSQLDPIGPPPHIGAPLDPRIAELGPLYVRAIQQRRAGLPKPAALDLIRLYALHPEAVKGTRAVPYICATLQDAGYFLEADLIEKSPDPTRAAAFLWNEFSPAATALGPQSAANLTSTALYLRHAPDITAIEQAASAPGILDSPIARALHSARIARIALQAIEPELAAERYTRLTDAAEAAINSTDLPADDSVQLAQTLAASYLACQSFMSNGGQLRPNLDAVVKRLEPKALPLGRKMLRLYLAAWLKATPPGNDGADKLAAEIDRIVEWAQHDDHETVLGAYNTFLDQFPESPQAPDVLAKLADYCQTRMRDAAKAASLYARLIDKYPNAPNVEKAVLRQALALYENKDHRAALDTLAAFIQKKPGSPNIATARYMAALAEAALGLTDDAQAHMTSLVNEFPASPLAPRALYWLGMNHIMRQEYKDANDIFRMLVDRYPESNYAQQAKSYISNLEKTK